MSSFFTLNNGEQLYFDEHGDPAGKTLVCLHGLGGGGYFFAMLGQSLGGKFRVLSPDMPGSGFSLRGHRPITFDRLADAVVQLIEAKTTGPVTLVGHSMGAIVALKIYARLASRINSLIFLGGLPAAPTDSHSRLRERAARIRREGMLAVAPTIPPVLFAKKSLETMADKVVMVERLLAFTDAEGYAQTAIALADTSAADVVPTIRVPCLCVTGSQDRYAPPAAMRAFADSISGAIYHEIAGCAHLIFFEEPRGLDRIVDDFLTAPRKESKL